MQLLIYVGGTLVLLIFGVMLTAQGPFITMKTRSGEWVLALIVGGSLLAAAAAGGICVLDVAAGRLQRFASSRRRSTGFGSELASTG